ncbi:MAG: hypothetical protein WC464_06660 [Bdellovibrionales bacterium]
MWTKNQRAKRGFSLAEFAIVMAVAGTIFGGIWVVSASMNENAKQQKFTELLSTIVENIRGSYTTRPFFESTLVTTMMPLLTSMNVFPGDSVKKSGTVSVVVSPFGEMTNPQYAASPYKSIYVCGWADGATTSTRCILTGAATSNVPLFAIEAILSPEDCINAVMRNSDPAARPGLVAVYIDGDKQALPMNLQKATSSTTGCKQLTVNYVDFVYRLAP